MAAPKSRAASRSKSGSSKRVRSPKHLPVRIRRVRPTGPATTTARLKPAAAASVLPIGAISPLVTKNQSSRSSHRRLIAWVFGLLGAVVLLFAGAVLLLVTVDLRPWIEEYGSSSFDRPMTIGTLRIGWGDPLSLEIAGLYVSPTQPGAVRPTWFGSKASRRRSTPGPSSAAPSGSRSWKSSSR